MHGAHAQILSAAEMSVALRLPGSTRQTVRDAIADGSLTKTFGPRGTVHLVPTADLGVWTGALAALPTPRSAFADDVRMSAEQTADVVAAISEALLEGELTVDELDREVVARAGSWAGDPVMPAFQTFWPRWRQAVGAASHAGVLVFGADRGRKVTYVHPRRRDPTFAPASREEALRAFLHGYLRAYGPATPGHLARWLSTSVEWCDSVLRAADVEEVSVDGEAMWVNAGDTTVPTPARSVRLLPYFDALSVGFAPREVMFPGYAAERALARGQAGNYPVVVVDGAVQGVWHQRRAGRRVQVTVETWGRFGAQRLRQLEEQVARLGEVLEAEPVLALEPVRVGPHA
ncbi:MAG: winged helix DNA-binding domain-containing protein [Nocardioidaceae bacterium]|nr:winged helix DNA-binding domain-containing protein [Nocardioidaceae bacterium]NUS49845.1 winged helix DNA-binding domain-containing protein [Nocardioidaceae bacterium]